MDFSDQRLGRLARRMKARSFPAMLDPKEASGWRSFVADKLTSEGDWLNIQAFEARLGELALDENVVRDRSDVLQQLAEHAADVRMRYHL